MAERDVTGDTLIWTDFGLLPISSFFNGTEKEGQFVPAALGLPVYDGSLGKLLPYSADARISTNLIHTALLQN